MRDHVSTHGTVRSLIHGSGYDKNLRVASAIPHQRTRGNRTVVNSVAAHTHTSFVCRRESGQALTAVSENSSTHPLIGLNKVETIGQFGPQFACDPRRVGNAVCEVRAQFRVQCENWLTDSFVQVCVTLRICLAILRSNHPLFKTACLEPSLVLENAAMESSQTGATDSGKRLKSICRCSMSIVRPQPIG